MYWTDKLQLDQAFKTYQQGSAVPLKSFNVQPRAECRTEQPNVLATVVDNALYRVLHGGK